MAQEIDEEQKGFLTSLNSGKVKDEAIKFAGWIIFLRKHLGNKVLYGAHHSKYTINACVTKMYQDMKRKYCSPSMKKDVVKFIAKCLTCQEVKFEHEPPREQLQPLEVAT